MDTLIIHSYTLRLDVLTIPRSLWRFARDFAKILQRFARKLKGLREGVGEGTREEPKLWVNWRGIIVSRKPSFWVVMDIRNWRNDFTFCISGQKVRYMQPSLHFGGHKMVYRPLSWSVTARMRCCCKSSKLHLSGGDENAWSVRIEFCFTGIEITIWVEFNLSRVGRE